jgi:hypothetical protein
MPFLARYESDPTPENWELVKVELVRTEKALQATIDASVTYFGTIEYADQKGAELAQLLSSRSVLLSKIGSDAKIVIKTRAELETITNKNLSPATPPQNLGLWMDQYQGLMRQLIQKITEFEKSLDALELATTKSSTIR